MQPDGSETGQLVVANELPNWLAGRRQRVCINQSQSNWAPVTSSVPQGSVLGLILFLIYINDLDTNIVSKISKFVDDTKLCRRARNPDDIVELQEHINKLVEWANKWQMNFNVDKCSVMHIGHNNMQGNNNMSNQKLRQQINSGIQESSSPKTSSGKRNREKLKNS